MWQDRNKEMYKIFVNAIWNVPKLEYYQLVYMHIKNMG